MAQLEGSVILTPHLDASVNVPDATTHISADVDADVTATMGVQLSAQKSFLLTEFGEAAIATPIGPQDLTFSVYATLSTNGSVGVSFKASYHQSLDTTCTFNFVNPNASGDKCSSSHQDSGSGLDVKSQLYGSMDVKAGLQYGVTWEIEDIAGPELMLTPWVEATVNTKLDPWQDIYVGASIGMAIQALQDCPLPFACFSGVTLWSNPNLLNAKLLDIWNSGTPFQGLVLSPNVARLGPGQSITFTATTPAGVVTGSSVTWTVLTGPVSMGSPGTFTATGNGVAVIEADYQGLTARAGIVVETVDNGPQSDNNSRGLVDGVLASWFPQSGAHAPVAYTVTASSLGPLPSGGFSSSESAVVLAPGTYAYLPNLAPGVRYQVTVSAVGADGRSVAASPETLTPLPPLPGVLAGAGSFQDVTTLGGSIDKTGVVGVGGAVLSANGIYAFYLVDGRSPLAPTSIFSPINENTYVVRQSLASPFQIQLASVGPSGKPVVSCGVEAASADGSMVAYSINGCAQAQVHDFTTNSSWSLTPPTGYSISLVDGVADNGTSLFTATNNSSLIEHGYIEAMGGVAQQIDTCTSNPDTGCGVGSINSSGSLVAYTGPTGSQVPDAVYLYNVTSKSNMNLFPSNTTAGDDMYAPLLSPDGSHIAVHYFSPNGTISGLAIKTMTGSPLTVSPSDIVASDVKHDGTFDQAMGLGDNGTVLAYFAYPGATGPSNNSVLMIYQSGKTMTAPALSTADTIASSASLSADGTTLLYALSLNYPVPGGSNYPGVYDWQVP
ncbi:MAG TPA: fibronectin type III domain-containing protein [Streptosporangiaceae bacterium]|nr:fibronectin type III domain-containing protein [Streptosporangiaceae bacterium]